MKPGMKHNARYSTQIFSHLLEMYLTPINILEDCVPIPKVEEESMTHTTDQQASVSNITIGANANTLMLCSQQYRRYDGYQDQAPSPNTYIGFEK
jgi:hypothetical protein